MKHILHITFAALLCIAPLQAEEPAAPVTIDFGNDGAGVPRYIALSQDGKKLLTAGHSGYQIWDVESGKELKTLKSIQGEITPNSLSFDGKKIATKGALDETAQKFDDSIVQIWNAESDHFLCKLEGHKKRVRGIVFSPDGKKIVTTSEDGTTRIWDAESGKMLHAFEVWSSSVVFSPDGKNILTVDSGVARLRNVETGAEIKTWNVEDKNMNYACFSPDGKKIVTVSETSNATVQFWDTESGEELHKLAGYFDSLRHYDGIPPVVFLSDGKRVITLRQDRDILRIWDIESGKELPLPGRHTRNEMRAISSDGRKIVVKTSWNTLQILDTEAEETPLVVSHPVLAEFRGVPHPATDVPKRIRSITFLADGKKVMITAEAISGVQIWDAETGKLLKRLNSPPIFSPSRKYFLMVNNNNYTVQIFDAKSGEELLKLGEHKEWITSAAFSHDEKKIVTAGYDFACIWDVTSGKELQKLEGHAGYTSSALFSPDGKKIILTSRDVGVVRIWDTESGKELQKLEGHTGPINTTAFLLGGEKIITGSFSGGNGVSADYTVRIWDTETGQELKKWENVRSVARSIDVSPDRKKVILDNYSTGTARIWDAESEKEINIEGTFFSFSPDGKRIIARNNDGTEAGRILDAESGKELQKINRVRSAAFSPDQKRIISPSYREDKRAIVFDAESGEVLEQLICTAQVTANCFSQDGKKIATGTEDGVIRIWDWEAMEKHLVDTAPASHVELKGNANWIISATFLPDGKKIVTTDYDVNQDADARIWNAESGKELHKWETRTRVRSPDGKKIAFLDSDNIFQMWDAETGKELKKWEGNTSGVRPIAFSPDGKKIMTIMADPEDKDQYHHVVRIHDVESGKELTSLDGNVWDVRSAVFSPDEKKILTVSGGYGSSASGEHGHIQIWDGETGKELHKIDTWNMTASPFFTPDGEKIVTAYNPLNTWSLEQEPRGAIIWDVESGKKLHSLLGDKGWVNSVAISPDGKRAATASGNTIRIWDAESGKELRKILGHKNRINSVAFSPDGKRIVSASSDGTARVWDTDTGKEWKRLRGRSVGGSASFSPDGKQVVTIGGGGARVWTLE